MAHRLVALALAACLGSAGCDAFIVLGPSGCDEESPCKSSERPHCDLANRRCVPAPTSGSRDPERELPKFCRTHADCASLVCDEFGAVGVAGFCVPQADTATAASSDELYTLLPQKKAIRLRQGIYQGSWQVDVHGVILVGPEMDPVTRRLNGPQASLSSDRNGAVVKVLSQSRLVLDGVTVTGGIGMSGHGVYCESADSAVWLRRVEVSENGGLGVWSRCPTYITQSVIGAWRGARGNDAGGVKAEHELGITNSFITHNGSRSSQVGGIAILPAQRRYPVVLVHLTLVGNLSNQPGNALSCPNPGFIELWHSLLWDNQVELTQSNLSNGCVLRAAATDDTDALNVVDLSKAKPPLFVGESDYHLQVGSPVVDKLLPHFGGPMLSHDFDEDPRPHHEHPDFGADELWF